MTIQGPAGPLIDIGANRLAAPAPLDPQPPGEFTTDVGDHIPHGGLRKPAPHEGTESDGWSFLQRLVPSIHGCFHQCQAARKLRRRKTEGAAERASKMRGVREARLISGAAE